MSQGIILAAVGQLPQDHAVLARAFEVSTARKCELTVVHVLDLPGQKSEIDNPDTLVGQAAFAARDRIEVALAELGAKAGQFEVRIDFGAPALQLIELCKELSPEVIVMRSHQKKRIVERLLGSTTDRVVAAGPVPVLVLKQPADMGYVRAVVATNGTDDSLGALRFVEGLLPDIKLHLVQAVEITPQLEEAMLRIGTGQKGLTAHRNDLTRAAKAHLQALVVETGNAVTSEVLRGDPANVLTRVTRRQDVDLIVLGPGRTGLIRRAFVGSVTRRLLRDAACDVLVCRPTPA